MLAPFLSLLLSLTPAAHACAGFFHPPDRLAESNTQEVIFEQDGAEVVVEYRVNLEVDVKDFGWVIPIPGPFVTMEDGDADRFEDLRNSTEPEKDLKEIEEGGCGAKSMGLKSDSANAGGGDTAGGVTIVYTGSTPTWSYVVLEATDSQDLLDWLAEHGWSVGDSAPSIEAYVAEGGFQFVAITLGIDEVESTVETELPPVRIRYEGSELLFPSRMAQYASEPMMHTTIYVMGDQRARVSDGWTQVDVPYVWDDGEAPDYMEYEAWPEKLAEIGDQGGYGLIYAGPAPDGSGWVSRFETLAERGVHTVDAVFALDAGEEELHTVISNRGGCNKPEGAGLLLPLFGVLWTRRRRA